MIKIAFVIDDLGLGGTQRQLLELLKRLNRNRFEPAVFALSEKKTALLGDVQKAGFSVVLIDQKGKFSGRVLYRLWRRIRRFSPTIVHTYLFTADFYGRIAALLARVPILVSSVRSTEPDKKRHYILADRVLGKWCDAVVANASCISSLLLRREKIDPSKLYTIPNGVDLGRFPESLQNGALRKSFNVPEGTFLLGTVGRLGPEKDHATLLAALAELRRRGIRAVLFLVGEGELRPQLVARAKALGLTDSVHFLGPRSDIPDLLGGLDLFILPSRYEGCPNVVLEAMAAGRCVVATAVGGTPEVVRNGETGILVEPGNKDALVEAVALLLSHPETIREMGKNGRRLIQETFTAERMVEQTDSLYRHLLKTKGISQ